MNSYHGLFSWTNNQLECDIMAQKKKAKQPKEDIRFEFATGECSEAFTVGLSANFPDCKFTISNVTVCVWAPKSMLPDIRTMSEIKAYGRRKIMCFTPFWILITLL